MEMISMRRTGSVRSLSQAPESVISPLIMPPEEGSGQEEADGVMPVPPLCQRILHAREQGIALVAEDARRHRQVVHDMEHGNGDDEGEVEPVGHIDMRLLPALQR